MSEYAMSTLFGSVSLDFMYISASAPDAPPLSDTTIGCFIRLFFWIAACIIRAIWSEAPPAPAATTISTGLVGSQPAIAGALPDMTATAAAAFNMFRTSLFLSSWWRLHVAEVFRRRRLWGVRRGCSSRTGRHRL